MKLIIKYNHTQNTSFDNRKEGALVRAARQQLPELKIVQEFDGFCIDNKGMHYDFISSDPAGYNRGSFRRLQNKEIKEISITLEPNRIY